MCWDAKPPVYSHLDFLKKGGSQPKASCKPGGS